MSRGHCAPFKCKIFALVRILRSRSLTQIFCFSELAHKHIHDGRTRHDRQIRATPRRQRARVQAAVHQAVRELQQEQGRDGLTVPAAAARAGVTPSTIYRRWGDLSQLLADRGGGAVAARAGAARHRFVLRRSAGLAGTVLRRNVLGARARHAARRAGHAGPRRPASDGFTRQQIEAIRERAIGRASRPPRRSRSSRAWWRRSCMACCSPTRRRAPPGCWRWFGKWRPPGAPARRESARRDSC